MSCNLWSSAASKTYPSIGGTDGADFAATRADLGFFAVGPEMVSGCPVARKGEAVLAGGWTKPRQGAQGRVARTVTYSTFVIVAVRFRGMGLSLKQFAQMQARVSGRSRGVVHSSDSPSDPAREGVRQGHTLLLGLDPSLRGTGFGLVRAIRSECVWVAHGVVRCDRELQRTRCLARIHEQVRDLIQEHRPTVCVVEGLFFAQNHQTTLIMGEARGAALAAAAMAGLEIYEIAPRKVKQAIVGYGAAGKLAVARMVQRLLALSEPPEGDASDALALALVFAQEQRRVGLAPRKSL